MPRTIDSVVTSRNPATGALVAETPVSSPEEVTHAVQRARDAFGPWSSLPFEGRADLLVRFAGLVERDRDELAALVVAELGKLRAEAEGEVDWTAASARWYAEHLPGSERSTRPGSSGPRSSAASRSRTRSGGGSSSHPCSRLRASTRATTPGGSRTTLPTGSPAAVYTSSAERVGAAQERLEVGVIGVNQRCDSAELEAPFGGAKSSGNGFPEGGEYAYSGVTMLKAVYAAPARP